MTLLKQKYNADFEYVGQVLTSAFEKNVLEEKNTKTLSAIMKSVFDMFVYTNSIETQNILLESQLSDQREDNNKLKLEIQRLQKEIDRY